MTTQRETTATSAVFDELIERYPAWEPARGAIEAGYVLLHRVLSDGGTVYLAGNGGSAADCEHFAAELLKSFEARRDVDDEIRGSLEGELAMKLEAGLPAVPLTGFVGARTAIENDVGGEWVFAQLVASLGRAGDALVCFTTSGASTNLLHAARVARAMGVKVVAMTGKSGGALAGLADVEVRAPGGAEVSTAAVQEMHLPMMHALARALERAEIRVPRGVRRG